jgi:hypothetical protein
MIVKVINNIEAFEKLRENWNAIYSVDPNTTIFVSWQWMFGWIKAWSGFTKGAILHEWEVVGIKPDADSPYIAFMTICTKSIQNSGFQFIRDLNIRTLYLGGYPFSDNTGFICLPECSEKAIPMFATYLQKHAKWDIFEMRNVFDPRLDLFLKCFSQKSFEIREIDGTICPYIILPDSWDKYLQEYLGTATRRSLKYDTRKIQNLNEFRITHVNSKNLESQIETLLALYQTRWGQKSETQINRFRTLFKSCFENHSLWLDILWEGTEPIAGFAVYPDYKMKNFTTYTIASNKKYAKWSPGKVMVGYSIKYAIENGFQIFDFGAGDEEYKYSFGTVERINRNVFIIKETNIKVKKNLLRQYNKVKNTIPVTLKNLVKSLFVKVKNLPYSSLSRK